MTGVIVLDDSGDLGSKGTKYFTIAAIIMFRPRHLKPAYKLLQNRGIELKWYTTNSDFRKKVLETMNNCQFTAVYSSINKNQPLSRENIYGNELYETMIKSVIKDALSVAPCKDLKVYLDRNRFITEKRFKQIIAEECQKQNFNLKDSGFRNSRDNPCLQLVDFVAGAVHANIENGDDTLSIISEKVSVARRS